ncbi:regulator of chromosome condensation 1/beta-lactamase-inhibitor protein II [Zychaea mexicana]|uniref:regulator of chromosome condensation 1/beta-lactamase-inhibitor protein II n=1 Tax=Zychaea mexicana TaxID=64656 RepID=UPI0022FE311C|nr:regulator of chromosome condensation 1/beta-lactamase-inhibitor protein II [Zychaea mexicana]KAI9499339.1 regulator of chromosome condensation 1/beta-lactamase-inhibitor protein II [Zychaea mexicana]
MADLSVPSLPEETGHVFVFGTGDTGQLGLGDEMLIRKRPMPLKVLDDEEIVDVVCGGMHTIATTREGRVWSWGCNDQGALGRSGEEYEPARVENLDNEHIVKVACGDSVTIALNDEGRLFCWGTFRSSEGALGFSKEQDVQKIPAVFEPLSKETIVDIAAGADHCVALTNDGRVYTWGNGQQYQLGRRISERHKKNALMPETLRLRNIKAIGAGAYHSFALSHNNELYVWGFNNFQQCGLWTDDNRSPPDQTMPTVITTLEGQVKQVAAGEHHSLVLMEDGHVYAFGRADSSQLGLPSAVIQELTQDQGANGDTTKSGFKRAIGMPTRIPNLENVKAISSCSNHSLAVTNEGVGYTWGFGETSALGNGSDEDEEVPCQLTGQKLEGFKVLRVAGGGQHSAIVATNSL